MLKQSFTLIELVIVMVVITVLAASWVVISLGQNRLIAFANKLMFDLRYAQQLAISRQVSCGISLIFLATVILSILATLPQRPKTHTPAAT